MVRNGRASSENVREKKNLNLTWDKKKKKKRNNSPDENNTGTLPPKVFSLENL